jgi:hypothetical protein
MTELIKDLDKKIHKAQNITGNLFNDLKEIRTSFNKLKEAISVTRCCETVKGRKDHNIDIAYNGYCTKCTSRENKPI